MEKAVIWGVRNAHLPPVRSANAIRDVCMKVGDLLGHTSYEQVASVKSSFNTAELDRADHVYKSRRR